MRRDLRAAFLCGVAALCFSTGALAAPARIRFQIEPKPYAEALLDLAQQANVTLIGAAACPGQSAVRIAASLTLEEALGQLLAGAPCAARVVAPGAVEVSALPQAQAAPRVITPVTVSDVLITATRRVRNTRQLAVAVTAVPQEQLQTTGATDAGEAAGQLAGVVATNLGPGRNKLLFRGLSDGAYTGRARSVVATYVDDLPVNYNAPDPDLRLVDVERVEVARGPQGALYGAGSLAGIYRIVTRKPDLEQRSGEIRVTGAVTRDGAPSGAVEGFINQPLFGDVLAARLSGYEEIQGGYLDDVAQNRKDVDRTERRGARLSLRYQPSDAWSVLLTAAGQHLRSDDTHYTNPGLGLTRSVGIPEPHVNDIESASLTVRRSWGWGELSSSTGYVRHAYGSLYDSTATQQNFTSFPAKTSAYVERTRTRMLVEDVVLTSRGAGPLEWLAGLYASDTTVHSPTEFLAQAFGVNVPVYSDDRHDGIRELALYGEVAYRVAPSWMLAVGGRAFSIRSQTRSHVESERFDPRDLDRSSNLNGVSPKISLQTTLRSGDLAYGVISEGYRAGGVNSGGALPLPITQETYAPDRLVNYELGLKMERLERRLSLNAAAFYDVWTDIQTDQFRDFVFRDTGIPYSTNAGDAAIVGVETELGYLSRNGLSAQLNGRLTRTHITRVNPAFASRLVDSLPGAPAVSGGATVSYERELFGAWTLRLMGQVTYVGKSPVTFDSDNPTTGGYTRTKVSAEFSGPRVGVQLYVSNPFNAYSDTFAFGNPFNPDRTRQITPQRPITVGVTLSGKI